MTDEHRTMDIGQISMGANKSSSEDADKLAQQIQQIQQRQYKDQHLQHMQPEKPDELEPETEPETETQAKKPRRPRVQKYVDPDKAQSVESQIRAHILYILGQYPIVSPTMIQVGGISTLAKRNIWGPVLDEMVDTGEVTRWNQTVRTPKGSVRQITKISLPKFAPSAPDDGMVI